MNDEPVRVPVSVQALRDELIGSSPWRSIDVVTETGSTNADLILRAAVGKDIDGAVLIAENQTAGRGRNGRSWSAVPGAQIIMSVGVGADGVPGESWGWVPLAAGLAVVDTVRAVENIEVGLKWPNDVLVGGRKLAGILAEVATPRSVIVVGIGVNVTLHRDEIADRFATSLVELGAGAPDRTQLIGQLLRDLGSRFAGWRKSAGADPRLRADYRECSLTIGARVRATLPGDREIVGIARSVDEHGRLLVDTAGHTVAVSAGDVVHVRPG